MTVPDFWTCALSNRLSFCQNTTRKSEERVEFLDSPPTLFSSLFLQQSGRRSSDRFKKAYPFPAVCLSWKSRPVSLIQFLWFRITFCSSMNEQRNLWDRQRDLMGCPVWLRYLEELNPYLSFMTRLGWVHLWLRELLIQPWWRSPRMPQSHSRDLPSCPPLPPHLWPEPFCHPHCKHSPSHTNWLSAWAKPFHKGSVLVCVRVDGFKSRHGTAHDPKSLLNDVCLCNIDWLRKGTVYQSLQPPQAAIVD